jgi:hypothetical protein
VPTATAQRLSDHVVYDAGAPRLPSS